MQLSQENENLKAEIRDLNEKLETLKGIGIVSISCYPKKARKLILLY